MAGKCWVDAGHWTGDGGEAEGEADDTLRLGLKSKPAILYVLLKR